MDPESCTFDVNFLGVYHQDEHKHLVTCRDTIAGRAMAQWWDVSTEAGPATRPASKFEEQPPTLQVLACVDQELKTFGFSFKDF